MQRTLTYLPEPSAPRLRLPEGACDTHVHVFGPSTAFPFSPDSALVPADASKETLFALHAKLGIERCVIVQSLVHGFDNRVIEDAIAAGGGRYLGVALVRLDVTDAELRRLADAGFRGVRFNFMKHLGASAGVEQVVEFTQRLPAFGMHLQVHFESSLIHSLAGPLARSAVPVVIDHIGRVDASQGTTGFDFAALHATLENPLFRVKVSGIDRISPYTGSADYAPGIMLARQLVEDFPAQCFWGTDWPHPNHSHTPDDGALVDALAEIAPDEHLRKRLLVDNPQQFYRFEA